MSFLKIALLVAAVIGVGVGMVRSEEPARPAEQNYDGYGPRPTYGRAVYADSTVHSTKRTLSKSEVRDQRISCLDMKTTRERHRCMSLTDDE